MGNTILVQKDELVERCKNGDVGSFKLLYDKYAKAMFNTSLRVVKNLADAEDILQESFIEIHKHLHQYDSRASIGSWMKRIVINKSIDFLRKRKVHFEELEDKNEFENYREEPVQLPNNLKVKRVMSAINNLPTGYRTVLSLYLLEGYDHKEIAQILQVSESTTRTQYMRAKKKLLSTIND